MQELVKSVSIDNLLNQFAAVQERVAKAIELLNEAKAISDRSGITYFQYMLGDRMYDLFDKDRLERFQNAYRAKVWQYLMNESGMRSFMDATRRDAWDREIENKVTPELTRENIAATFQTLHNSRGEMLEAGVLEVFKKLSWNHKTNQPFKFGKKIIVANVHNGFYLNSYSQNRLDDLMRVFHVLDGKPEPDHRNGMYSLVLGAKHTRVIDTDYISAKLFENGNIHINFKRLDIVDAMNGILHRHYPDAIADGDKHSR
jgi:hypothetical protein